MRPPTPAPLTTTRRVWAALTAEPQISTRRLAEHLKISPSTAHRHLRVLREAGYIEQHGTRARRVIVPMYSALPRRGGRGLEVFR